ncbi:hypothetical protein BJ546DRAFT_1061247 [Cryomyces antarcticus]
MDSRYTLNPVSTLQNVVLRAASGHAVGQREHLAHVGDLAKRPECQLRIIFAPLDVPQAESANGHLALYERFAVPTAFLSGRLQSVSKSFGACRDEHGTETSWFHFLAKNLTVQKLDNRLRIVDPYPSSHPLHRSQVSYNWIKSGYFLSSGGTGNAGVTLVCFGASQALVQRFERLLSHPAWEDVLREPFVLYEIVVDELYLQLDNLAWSLADVFREIESGTLNRAGERDAAAGSIEFLPLHNVSKHIIYLKEASDAAVLLVDDLCAHHKRLTEEKPAILSASIQDALKYKKGLFQSTQLRLTSLEKRMQNIISLSFNLVNQQDSRIMQQDSSSMKTIAAMTLIFLPGTLIASLFSSNFFNFSVGSDGQSEVRLSSYFWVFWIIAVPLTVLTVVLWRLYQFSTREKLKNRPVRWRNFL